MKILPFLVLSLTTASIYFSIAVFLLNPALVSQTIWSSSPLLSKLTLLTALLESSWMALSHIDFFLLVTTSLLVGANMMISILLLQRLKNLGSLSFSFGGGSVAGIFSAGCASCGFSAFSLFGASGTLAFLPLRGSEIYILAITLLLFSLYYNIRNLQKPLLCKSPKS